MRNVLRDRYWNLCFNRAFLPRCCNGFHVLCFFTFWSGCTRSVSRDQYRTSEWCKCEDRLRFCSIGSPNLLTWKMTTPALCTSIARKLEAGRPRAVHTNARKMLLCVTTSIHDSGRTIRSAQAALALSNTSTTGILPSITNSSGRVRHTSASQLQKN